MGKAKSSSHPPVKKPRRNAATAAASAAAALLASSPPESSRESDFMYQEIKFGSGRDCILLCIENESDGTSTVLGYDKSGTGCILKKEWKQVSTSRKNYITEALSGLKTTMEKGGVRRLKFVCHAIREKQLLASYIKGVAQKIHELDGHFQVESADLHILDSQDLDKVLKKVKPGSLKMLKVKLHDDSGELFNVPASIDQHLEHLEDLNIRADVTDLTIEQVTHIKNVEVDLASITMDQLTEYKSKVLQDGTIDVHFIGFEENILSIEDLKKVFRPYTPIYRKDFARNEKDEEQQEIGIIPFPDPTKGSLLVEISEDHFRLERRALESE